MLATVALHLVIVVFFCAFLFNCIHAGTALLYASLFLGNRKKKNIAHRLIPSERAHVQCVTCHLHLSALRKSHTYTPIPKNARNVACDTTHDRDYPRLIVQ